MSSLLADVEVLKKSPMPEVRETIAAKVAEYFNHGIFEGAEMDVACEILRLMAGGFSNKEIANSLHVAEGTIKNHASNILSKLGVRDRTRAVLKAFEMKIV